MMEPRPEPMIARDLVGYGEFPPHPAWPGGALIAVNGLRVSPDSVYSVQYTAFMIFIVIIGGLGTIEGPILGAVVFFALQQLLDAYGTWYLIALGAVAIGVVLLAPKGLWGLASRGRYEVFPVGHTVLTPPVSAK